MTEENLNKNEKLEVDNDNSVKGNKKEDIVEITAKKKIQNKKIRILVIRKIVR